MDGDFSFWPVSRSAILGHIRTEGPFPPQPRNLTSQATGLPKGKEPKNIILQYSAAPTGGPDSISHLKKPFAFEGRQIMVVADDNRNIYALQQIFEGLGCELVIANSGREALVMLSLCPHIDLILMEIMMPVMAAYQAICLIRKLPEKANLSIIALTAKAMENDRDQCLAAGANNYLAKPVVFEKLLMLMRVWLSAKRFTIPILLLPFSRRNNRRSTIEMISFYERMLHDSDKILGFGRSGVFVSIQSRYGLSKNRSCY